MTRVLRIAILSVSAMIVVAATPCLTAAVRHDPGVIHVTVDVSGYLGRSVHFFAGQVGSYSPFILPNGRRVIVPLTGVVDDLGTVFVRKSRVTFAVDAALAPPRGLRIAAVGSTSILNAPPGRTPIADLVAEIDQEPAPSSR